MTGESGAVRGTCLNCGAELLGPHCHRCGQEDRDPAPKLGELLAELAEVAWNWDSRTLLTLRELLLFPGRPTREYNRGRRARYVSPVRLFLVVSAVFLAGATLAGDVVMAQVADELAGSPEARARWPELMRFFVWSIFLMVPGFAVLLHAVYPRSGRPYVHHLVFALHYHTLIFLGLALLMGVLVTLGAIAALVASTVLLPVLFLWPIPALRGAYGGGWLGCLLRGGLVLFVHYTVVIPLTTIPVSLAWVFLETVLRG